VKFIYGLNAENAVEVADTMNSYDRLIAAGTKNLKHRLKLAEERYPGLFDMVDAVERTKEHNRKRKVRPRVTSLEARRSVSKESISKVQAAILNALWHLGPLSDEDIFKWLDRYGWVASPSGSRTRRSELVAAGKVVADGTTTNSRGRKVTLWRKV
jgi:hypothetical protein